jgi:hypothetical protein
MVRILISDAVCHVNIQTVPAEPYMTPLGYELRKLLGVVYCNCGLL